MSLDVSYCPVGQLYHLRLNTVGQDRCFNSPQDYFFFLDVATRASFETGVRCHAFSLFDHDAHLLVTPEHENSITRWVGYVTSAYQRYQSTNGYSVQIAVAGVSLIDDEAYALTLSRYIELLPVRRGLVADASHYNFSSYQQNAIKDTRWGDQLLIQQSAYQGLGLTLIERRRRYRAMFCLPIPRNTIKQIENANDNGRVVGDDLFKRRLERRLTREQQRRLTA